MAEITWEGLREPAEQADPLEAQIPSISRAARRVMLSVSEIVKDKVLANLLLLGETKLTPSISEREAKRFVNGSI